MLQGHVAVTKTCAVHTEVICNGDVQQRHVAGTKSQLYTHENVAETRLRDVLWRHVPAYELTAFGHTQHALRHYIVEVNGGHRSRIG